MAHSDEHMGRSHHFLRLVCSSKWMIHDDESISFEILISMDPKQVQVHRSKLIDCYASEITTDQLTSLLEEELTVRVVDHTLVKCYSATLLLKRDLPKFLEIESWLEHGFVFDLEELRISLRRNYFVLAMKGAEAKDTDFLSDNSFLLIVLVEEHSTTEHGETWNMEKHGTWRNMEGGRNNLEREKLSRLASVRRKKGKETKIKKGEGKGAELFIKC